MTGTWLAGLYGLAAINLLVAFYALYGAIRYWRFASRAGGETTLSAYRPSVALLVPCCGAEPGLAENLRALTCQRYPRLTIVFVLEDASDAAFSIVREIVSGLRTPSRVVLAGPARSSGQKVHNLGAAVRETPEAEVLAFADSDIRPDEGWLARLVGPLERTGVGVATGYRFYLPERGSFASLLRSAWNAGVLTLLGDHDHNFAWGGSMALRRETFFRAGVPEAWQGALSDDYALTHAVRRAGLRVEFVPSCLVASEGPVGLAEVLRWCGWQMAITRVYWPNLWRIAGASQVAFVAFLLVALVMALRGHVPAAVLLAVVLSLGAVTSDIRRRAIEQLAPRFEARLRSYRRLYPLLVPLAGLLTVYGFARSALSRRIVWRGKAYHMISPNETVLEQTATEKAPGFTGPDEVR